MDNFHNLPLGEAADTGLGAANLIVVNEETSDKPVRRVDIDFIGR